MPISYICGDILSGLDGKPTVVCHQVNCMGVMGSGLAKQIKEKFPVVYESYKRKCKSGVDVGDIQICNVSDNTTIVNCFSQYLYGRDRRYTQYDAFANCMQKVHGTFPDKTIRIPFKIGCGLAGGDWNIIKTIIESEFCKSGNVEIWELPYGYKTETL